MSDDLDDRNPHGSSGAVRTETRPYGSGDLIAGKYELIRCLGEGGMGSVWVARNLALDAQVAIKLIKGDVKSPMARERLLAEARAAARLKHPAIVRVFDFGKTERDDPFIVMELLAGESLGNLIGRHRRLPAIYAVQLVLPIIDALHVAHGSGVVHRDLKPDNVFLASYDGRVLPKVVDFGVAKVEQQGLLESHKLTETGTVVGSPEYMAPEQAAGEDLLDHRVDIWGLCMMLYESVTGRTAFRDSNYHALLRKIIEKPARSILDFGAGDTALWRILERGLQKDPDERWQSMLHLGKSLAEWLTAHGISEDVSGHALRSAWIDRRVSIPDIDAAYSDALVQNALASWRPPLDSREEGTVPGAASLIPPPGNDARADRQSQTAGAHITLGRPRETAPSAAERRYRVGVAIAAAALLAIAIVLGLMVDDGTTAARSASETAARPAAAPAPSAPLISVVPVTPPSEAAPAPAEPAPRPPAKVTSARLVPPLDRGVPRQKAAATTAKTVSSAARPEPRAPETPAPQKVYEDLGF